MPPKVRFFKEEIVKTAKEIIEEEGVQNINARNIAKRMRASVAPIYTQFKSVEELKKEVLIKIQEDLLAYCRTDYTPLKFRNFGIGMILYAKEHSNCYSALYSIGKDVVDIIQSVIQEAKKELKNDPRFQGLSNKDINEIMEKVWIYTHGLASLVQMDLIQLKSQGEIIKVLEKFANMLLADLKIAKKS